MSEIKNDGFWVDFETTDLTAMLNTPSKYDDTHLSTVMQISIAKTNEDLQTVKTHLLSLSYADFDAYNATITESIDEKPITEFYYRVAVYFWSKLQLLRAAPGLGRSVQAEKAADLDFDMAKWLEQQYYWAIGQLSKRILPAAIAQTVNTGVFVELI